MTSDETPADVIEAAAKAVHDTACGCGDPHPCDYAAAHALHAAGLLADPAATVQAQSTLADPAGRDDPRVATLRRERDHAREEAELAERDRRTYHGDALRAEAEVARLREKWLAFTSALGFGDNKTERAAELSEMVDPIEQAFSDARDHQECAVICELCGDPLASKTCDECHGSGCLPNSALAYLECGTCAGVGKIHEGCVEKSYTDLAAERDELRAALDGEGEQ